MMRIFACIVFQRFFKRQASVFFFFSWMIVDVVADRKSINPESLSLNLKTKSEDSNQTIVFYRKSSGSAFDFHKSLNFMIEQFEVREEMLITPNKYPKILLKIDSATALDFISRLISWMVCWSC